MTWQEELEVLAETKFFKSSINDLHDTTHKFVSFDKLTPFITSLLEKQRESCYKNYLHGFSDDKDWDKNAILNAPEPKP